MRVVIPVRPRSHQAVHPLSGGLADYSPVLELIGHARYVLLGEATHGTHEFYRARADISKRLIVERGFNIVAWEADWPDTVRVNRFIRGRGDDRHAIQSLGDFKRFPAWMWRNRDVVEFIAWLRKYNDALLAGRRKVGLYGLDLYSLYTSIGAVITYLESVDQAAAAEARRRYGCFEDFGHNAETYGRLSAWESCEDEAVEQLLELRRHAADWLRRDGRLAADELFFAEQNARVIQNAEHYYRALYHGDENTWNLRDTHMANTLDELTRHVGHQGETPKAVVWAHNSHLGDARATQMGRDGELNVGQLARERHGASVKSVGFTTYSGAVTAASDWEEEAESKRVRPALPGSYEAEFHANQPGNFVLITGVDGAAKYRRPRLERAIGVVYKPETERACHYFQAQLDEQFDVVIHFDETHAVEPLERTSLWERGEPDETYPSGL